MKHHASIVKVHVWVNIFIFSPVRFTNCLGLLRYLTHLHDYLYDIGTQEVCFMLNYLPGLYGLACDVY